MVQGTVSPRFNAASTYTDDYGVYNSDPLDHEAARAVDLTPCSTTYGMNAGTVRTTRQLPGQRHMHTALWAAQCIPPASCWFSPPDWCFHVQEQPGLPVRQCDAEA